MEPKKKTIKDTVLKLWNENKITDLELTELRNFLNQMKKDNDELLRIFGK